MLASLGGPVDLSCFVNDRRAPAPRPGAVPGAAAVRSLLARTTGRWERELPAYDGSLYVQADTEGDAVQLGIWADTHAIAPADVERFSLALEDAAVTAV
jgi:hypothetical protein